MEYMDNFRDVAANAERMLVIVVQDRNYIKPFIRVSSVGSPHHGVFLPIGIFECIGQKRE